MSIIIDLIMIALLIGVIMHSIHLSQSLKNFQHLHGEITPMLKEHTMSLSNNMRYIDQLRNLTKEVNHTIQTRTPEVQVIKQDLEFLTNRANQIADHLEKLLQESRSMGLSTRPLASTTEMLRQEMDSQRNTLINETPNHDKPTTKTTLSKRLRQKINSASTKPSLKATTAKKTEKKVESYNFSSLSKKLADKVREKTYAA